MFSKKYSKKFASLVTFAIALAVFYACSETNTAGVLTETESGTTIAGIVVNSEGNSVAFARIALVRIKNSRPDSVATIAANENGEFSFENAPDSLFGILVYADSVMGYMQIATDSNFYKISTGAKATVFVKTENMNVGDSLCIGGTFSCAQVMADDLKTGSVKVENVPPGNYSQVNFWNNDSEFVVKSTWNIFAGDTCIISSLGKYNLLSIQKFALPDSIWNVVDTTIKERVLDSLIVPIQLKDFATPTDKFGNKVHIAVQNDYALATLNFKNDTSEVYWLQNETDTIDVYKTRVRYASKKITANKVIDNVFADSSFAVSFWLKFDSKNLADTGAILLSAKEDNIGFDIRQCSSDKNIVCTKIYNGIDSASTDTIDYGRTKILDGLLHNVIVSVHKKHLSIAVDGNIIRDTDLKLSPSFYKLPNIKLGEFELQNFILFSFGDFIRKPKELTWDRLNVWLKAFYLLQFNLMQN